MLDLISACYLSSWLGYAVQRASLKSGGVKRKENGSSDQSRNLKGWCADVRIPCFATSPQIGKKIVTHGDVCLPERPRRVTKWHLGWDHSVKDVKWNLKQLLLNHSPAANLKGGVEEYLCGEHPVSRANSGLSRAPLSSLYLKMGWVTPTRGVICLVHANKGPIFRSVSIKAVWSTWHQQPSQGLWAQRKQL